VRDGRYVAPTAPGYSIEMLPESLARYEYPYGVAWTEAALAAGG
jgi:L-fuconate dehydratase